MPSLTFLGAARTVTGSKFLLDTATSVCSWIAACSRVSRRFVNGTGAAAGGGLVDRRGGPHARAPGPQGLPAAARGAGVQGPRCSALPRLSDLCRLVLPTPAGSRKRTRGCQPSGLLQACARAAALHRGRRVPGARADAAGRLRSADAGRSRGSRSNSSHGPSARRGGSVMRLEGLTIMFGGDLGRYDRPVLPIPSRLPRPTCCSSNRRTAIACTSQTTTASGWRRSCATRRPRRQGDRASVRDRARRRGPLLAEDARGGRSDSEGARVTWTARWRPRPCEFYSSRVNELDDGAAAPRASAVASFATQRFQTVVSAQQSAELIASRDAGDRDRGERHGDGRPRAAPPQARAAGSAKHRALRRLSGRRHARPCARGRRRKRSRSTAQFVPVAARSNELDSMSAHADAGEISVAPGLPPPARMTFIVHGEPAALRRCRPRSQAELGHWPVRICARLSGAGRI